MLQGGAAMMMFRRSCAEQDDGKDTMLDMAFILIGALILFVTLTPHAAIPEGQAQSQGERVTVPAEAVVVELDESASLSVQGEAVTEDNLLKAIEAATREECQSVAFYAHPDVSNGEATRIRLMMKTKFDVLLVYEEQK
jgi:biopolymer transport protein ExbD